MTEVAGPDPADPKATSEEVLADTGSVSTMERVVTGDGPATVKRKKKKDKPPGEGRWIAGVFLLPAAVFLGAIVLYSLVYTVIRSLYHDGPSGDATTFAGFANYSKIFTDNDAFQSLKNNLIWVLVVPAVATLLGLIFAVLTERIRWSSAFKLILFAPMAISFLAAGVTWSLIYSDNPSRGLGNAVTVGVHNIFSDNTSYPELHSVGTDVFSGSDGKGYTTKKQFDASSGALLPLVGLDFVHPPAGLSAAPTDCSTASGGGLSGCVWNDFTKGGGGSKGKIDKGELGISGITVEALKGGKVVATTTTAADGSFKFSGLSGSGYTLKLPSDDFTTPFGGVSWLGQNLITWAIIVAYLWIYTGFCMVLLAAGMAAIPRDALEAARMDGATEFQVFRRVTAPLLAPVLMVVFVTMVINVLKIFDIVYVIGQTAGANQKFASVLAVQLFNDYGNQQFGAASAVGVALVILVIPAMIFQVYRFRKDQR